MHCLTPLLVHEVLHVSEFVLAHADTLQPRRTIQQLRERFLRCVECSDHGCSVLCRILALCAAACQCVLCFAAWHPLWYGSCSLALLLRHKAIPRSALLQAPSQCCSSHATVQPHSQCCSSHALPHSQCCSSHVLPHSQCCPLHGAAASCLTVLSPHNAAPHIAAASQHCCLAVLPHRSAAPS